MRGFVLVIWLLFSTAIPTQADPKQPQKKVQIVGIWEWQREYAPWRSIPRTGPARYEFTKDGKIKSSDSVEGTYEVEGENLKVKLGGKAQTWRISYNDAAELSIEEWGTDPDSWRQRWFKKK